MTTGGNLPPSWGNALIIATGIEKNKQNKRAELGTLEDLALLRRFSGRVKEVPTRRRMIGAGSPGVSGNSTGSWPVSSPSCRHSFFSSSSLALSLSSMAVLRALSAATISSRAARAASLSSASAATSSTIGQSVVAKNPRNDPKILPFPQFYCIESVATLRYGLKKNKPIVLTMTWFPWIRFTLRIALRLPLIETMIWFPWQISVMTAHWSNSVLTWIPFTLIFTLRMTLRFSLSLTFGCIESVVNPKIWPLIEPIVLTMIWFPWIHFTLRFTLGLTLNEPMIGFIRSFR